MIEQSMPVVRMDQVGFVWTGPRAWRMIVPDFQLPRGQHTVLRGASGSGKTTLLGLIGGLLSAAHGRVEVLGSPLHEMRESARDGFRAARIGIVFQQFNLLSYLSMLENVLLPCRFAAANGGGAGAGRNRRIDEAGSLLQRLGLPARLHKETITRLSVGQQQRVAVARALITRPALILADEPTSALDESATQEFLALLFEEAGRCGSTVLLASHDPSVAERFDARLEMSELVQVR